jgi:hypothetical protein
MANGNRANGSNTIFLFYAYEKGDIEDMTPEQKKRLRKAVEDIKREFGS